MANYDFKRGYLETDDGVRYNLRWCIQGMNKFDYGSKEYKIFQAVFRQLARRVSSEEFSKVVEI